MQRRLFLRWGIGIAGVGLLASRLSAQGQMDHQNMSAMPNMGHGSGSMPMMSGGQTALLPVEALPHGKPLTRLPQLQNQSNQPGLFRAQLTAAPVQVELAPGIKTTAWAYNGSLPGPLIEVHEGDTLEIRFINQLSQATTIHWHGLPVPPDQDGNPHDPVAPGQERLYRFTLPKGSAGTYWYHPHPHGHTPEQVFRGLAGALIVRAADDPLAMLPEQHLLISDLRLDSAGQIPANNDMDWMNGREGQFVLINGQRQPVITQSAPMERWRIWNACSARYLRLALPGHTLTLVGTDGGLLERGLGLEEILLAPGERIEVLVTGQESPLMALAYDRSKMGNPPPEKDLVLAQVRMANNLSGSSPALSLDKLRPITDPGPVKTRKRVVFSEIMDMQNGRHDMQFLVNGKAFDMNRVDLTSRVGEVELWEIYNDSHMDHPFHIHGTQFLVQERELKDKVTAEPYRAWRDTVNLRPYETVRIKLVQQQPGLRMYHCHVLEHEGLGMMATLKVV